MKKILFFTKEYQHPNLNKCGGTGIFNKRIAESLVKKGFQVIVFGSNKFPLKTIENGVELYFIKDFFKYNPIQEFLRSISGKLGFFNLQEKIYKKEIKYLTKNLKNFLSKRHQDIDIIETHDWDGISLYLSELNIPYIVRCHGAWTILNEYFGYRISKAKKSIEHQAMQKSLYNICVSNYSNLLYQKTFGIKSVLIKNGIDIPSQSNKNKIIPNSIFYIGNGSKEKGIDITIKVFKRIKDIIPNATLHLIGRNNFKKICTEHSEIKDYIHNHGFLVDQTLQNKLKKANIFIFPSKGETFGLSLCEIMSLGKVAIASNIPAFKEIIKHKENGFIAKNEDEYIQFTLQVFFDEILRQNIENKAKEEILKNFNFENTLKQTINFYKTILKTNL